MTVRSINKDLKKSNVKYDFSSINFRKATKEVNERIKIYEERRRKTGLIEEKPLVKRITRKKV